MLRQSGLIGPAVAGFLPGFCLFLACSWVFAAENKGGEMSSLIAKVDPCVVTIKMAHSQGSGFVVSAKGMIATNYHVIEGAKEATVVFPDKSSFEVKGFVALMPNKDLALLYIDAGEKTFPFLGFAGNMPDKGERVFAFGAPLGMSGSVSEGIVAALRSGEEVRNILHEGSDKDIYKDVLGYDTDMHWIQTTAPISPGNSGGPLVNAQGEVVGINTWQSVLGQNLNFTVSATHVQNLIAHAGTMVQSLSMLPPSRRRHESTDPNKTLSSWNQLNRLMNELSKALAPIQKKLAAITPADPRNPLKGLNSRMKRRAVQYHAMGQAYSSFAGKVKALKTAEVDPELLAMNIAVADLAQRTGDLCEKTSVAGNGLDEEEFASGEASLSQSYARAAANLRTGRDVLRAELSLKYHKEFPTLEQTAAQPEQDEDGGNATTKEPKTASERSAARTWTDSSGDHHVEAKFRGVKDGKVSLERLDGTMLTIPLEKLSEADRHFVEEEK